MGMFKQLVLRYAEKKIKGKENHVVDVCAMLGNRLISVHFTVEWWHGERRGNCNS